MKMMNYFNKRYVPIDEKHPFNSQSVLCYTSDDQFILKYQQDLKSDKTVPSVKSANSGSSRFATDSSLSIIAQENSIQTKRVLKISKITGKMEMAYSNILQNARYMKKLSKSAYSAFLGVFKADQKFWFLVFCDQNRKACEIQGMEIYQISTLSFVNIFQKQKVEIQQERIKRTAQDSAKKKQVYRKIHELRALLNFGFYFSYEYNLTQSFENQQYGKAKAFTWNKHLLAPLEESRIDPQWQTCLIQGFVSSFKAKHKNQIIQYALVSRRSALNKGTSHFSSGVDKLGHVGNFVDTQQFVKIGDYIVADSQIRGTVPILYSGKQQKLQPTNTEQFESSHIYFLEHFNKLKSRFMNIFCVNLMSSSANQKILTKQYETHMRRIQDNDSNVKYFYFDFNNDIYQECNRPDKNYKKVDAAVMKMISMKENLGYCIFDTRRKKVTKRSSGIIRTNCVDSLDRTNIFQSRVALASLQHILNFFDLWEWPVDISTNECSNLILEQTYSKKQLSYNCPLIKEFHKIWEENQRYLKYHYTGVYDNLAIPEVSIKVFQKADESTIKSEFNELMPAICSPAQKIVRSTTASVSSHLAFRKRKDIDRINPNNPQSIHMMQMIDTLFGQNKVKQHEQELKNAESNKQNFQDLLISVISMKHFKGKQYVFQIPQKADILAVGLQQVQLSYGLKMLQDCICKNDKQLSGYTLLDYQYTTDNLLAIFIKPYVYKKLTCIEKTSVNLSPKNVLAGFSSSKSASIVRIGHQHNLISFVSTEFDNKKFSQQTMINNLREIHVKAFQEYSSGVYNKSLSIMNDDLVFLFGNIYKSRAKKIKIKNQVSTPDNGNPEEKRVRTYSLTPKYTSSFQLSKVSVTPQSSTNKEFGFQKMAKNWMDLQKNLNEPNNHEKYITKETNFINQRLMQYRQYHQEQIVFEKQPNQTVFCSSPSPSPTISLKSIPSPLKKDKQRESSGLIKKESLQLNSTHSANSEGQAILSIQRILYSSDMQVSDLIYELNNGDVENSEEAYVYGQYLIRVPFVQYTNKQVPVTEGDLTSCSRIQQICEKKVNTDLFQVQGAPLEAVI